MRRLLALSTLPVFWATGVIAGDHFNCDDASQSAECTPVYACIGEQGEWFKGQTIGQKRGTVSGTLASGANCTGKWNAPVASGTGKLDLTCNNGIYMQVYYTNSDPETKTSFGHGISMDGRFVQGWSGQNVDDYFSQSSGTLTCGPNTVPLG